MVLNVGVPIAVPDVEVTCHDYHVTNVPYVIPECFDGCLITVRVHIYYEVYVLIIVEWQNVDISVIYNISI